MMKRATMRKPMMMKITTETASIRMNTPRTRNTVIFGDDDRTEDRQE